MSYVVPAEEWLDAAVGSIGDATALLRDEGCHVEGGFVLTAEALSDTLRAAGVLDTVRDGLDTIAEHPVRTGKIIAELRDLIGRVSLSETVESELAVAVQGLFARGGAVDVIASPVGAVAGIETYHRVRGIESVEGVIDAVRACWQSLFSEETSYRGRGRFGTGMAVIVAPARLDLASRLDAAAVKARPAHRDAVSPGLVAVEDLDAMACLELGRCEPGFRRMFLKRVWLRRSLRELGLRTYRVFYLVYALDDLEPITPALLRELRLPLVRVDWGDGWRVVPREELVEVLREAHAGNVLSDGWHACVQVAELVPASVQGFATRIEGGEEPSPQPSPSQGEGAGVIIEAFPGGVHGTKDGLFVPSRYELDGQDRTVGSSVATFVVAGERTLTPGPSPARGRGEEMGARAIETGDWRTVEAAPYELELPEDVRVELAMATRMLTKALGEVRVEWYLHDGLIYIKDVSIESGPLDRVVRANVISAGAVEGTVYRIGEIAAYDRLGGAYDLGVVNRDGQRESAMQDAALRRDLEAMSALDRPIVVAAHASIGLMPLVPYVRGFIFERGSLLSHTAIVLRESGVPAVVCSDALSRLRTGDVVSIGASGELIVRPGMSATD